MSRLFESLQRVIELTPSGIMVPETMLKLAHLQLELEPAIPALYASWKRDIGIRKRGKKLAGYLKISSELVRSFLCRRSDSNRHGPRPTGF